MVLALICQEFLNFNEKGTYIEDIAKVDWETFKEVPGVGQEKLKEIKEIAKKAIESGVSTDKLMAELAKAKEKLMEEKLAEAKLNAEKLAEAKPDEEKPSEETTEKDNKNIVV